METWLVDTALLKMLSSTNSTRLLQHWCESNKASLFLSAASQTEIIAAIAKVPTNQPERSTALRRWFDELSLRFADRIHPIDSVIAKRAGVLSLHVRDCHPRHRLHDALLVATAQVHGHGLLTRRDGVFGSWTNTVIGTL
jgi:predicted nucleic acid-binding protein